MLYQLVAYYTIDSGSGKSLWDYLSLTVIVFQNAAVLEVCPESLGNISGDAVGGGFLCRLSMRLLELFPVMSSSRRFKFSPG